MSSPTEQQLRDLLAAEADAAPRAIGLADGALRKVRRRRRVQLASGGVVALAAVTTGVLVMDLPGRPPDSTVAVSVESTGESAPTRSDPAPSQAAEHVQGMAASCAQEYSPAAVASAPFAFDGTVIAIGPARSNRPGVELVLSAVTFRVHTWFRGGSGDTVTVDMDTPLGPTTWAEPAVPPYEVGTRLLVSGAPRWGGEPLDAAIAWPCGFTRPYDRQTAAAWAAATD